MKEAHEDRNRLMMQFADEQTDDLVQSTDDVQPDEQQTQIATSNEDTEVSQSTGLTPEPPIQNNETLFWAVIRRSE